MDMREINITINKPDLNQTQSKCCVCMCDIFSLRLWLWFYSLTKNMQQFFKKPITRWCGVILFMWLCSRGCVNRNLTFFFPQAGISGEESVSGLLPTHLLLQLPPPEAATVPSHLRLVRFHLPAALWEVCAQPSGRAFPSCLQQRPAGRSDHRETQKKIKLVFFTLMLKLTHVFFPLDWGDVGVFSSWVFAHKLEQVTTDGWEGTRRKTSCSHVEKGSYLVKQGPVENTLYSLVL